MNEYVYHVMQKIIFPILFSFMLSTIVLDATKWYEEHFSIRTGFNIKPTEIIFGFDSFCTILRGIKSTRSSCTRVTGRVLTSHVDVSRLTKWDSNLSGWSREEGSQGGMGGGLREEIYAKWRCTSEQDVSRRTHGLSPGVQSAGWLTRR